MKTLMTLLLLASIALNAVLLTGCMTVTAHRLWTPQPIPSDDMMKISAFLPDEPRDALARGQNWLARAQGKIVILLNDTEENRTAKRMVIHFIDEN